MGGWLDGWIVGWNSWGLQGAQPRKRAMWGVSLRVGAVLTPFYRLEN